MSPLTSDVASKIPDARQNTPQEPVTAAIKAATPRAPLIDAAFNLCFALTLPPNSVRAESGVVNRGLGGQPLAFSSAADVSLHDADDAGLPKRISRGDLPRNSFFTTHSSART
jgi:hypothetical protein